MKTDPPPKIVFMIITTNIFFVASFSESHWNVENTWQQASYFSKWSLFYLNEIKLKM